MDKYGIQKDKANSMIGLIIPHYNHNVDTLKPHQCAAVVPL